MVKQTDELNGQMERAEDIQTDRHMDRQTDGWTARQTESDGAIHFILYMYLTMLNL